MLTLIVDQQTDYFWSLVNKYSLQKHFIDNQNIDRKLLDKVEIAVIKTPTKVDEVFLEKYPDLKMIIRAGTGYDNINLQLTSRKGVIVSNTPHANIIAAYEHTLSLILALIKRHQRAKTNLLGNCWKDNHPLNLELNELRVLVVGVGRIGTKVAQTLQYLGAEVYGVDPYLTLTDWQNKAIEPVNYDDGLNRANLITYHCPLTEETVDYFSMETLQSLSHPIFIINTARGKIVNEKALYQGLLDGLILGAGLDVFVTEPNPILPFSGMDNVYITPHTGAYTLAAKKRLSEEILNVWKSFVYDGIVLNRLSEQ